MSGFRQMYELSVKGHQLPLILIHNLQLTDKYVSEISWTIIAFIITEMKFYALHRTIQEKKNVND